MASLTLSITKLRTTFHILLFGGALCVPLTLTADAQERPADSLAAKLAGICRKHDVPAMTAAVVDANGLVKSQCFGIRKRETSDKVELSDRFPLGSCTKSMTATLAAVLVDAGKIDWETSIGEVWPKATDEHIHPKLRTTTLDELLSHQSGLPSDISGQAWLRFFKEEQSPLLERRRLLKLVLSNPPSQRQGTFSYSNLGYVIVAAMLETRAREPFEALMKKHVFDPLEMHSADFRSMKSAKQLQPPLLWGHQAENGEPVDPRSVGAENPTVYASCGTVHLSIDDYAKYARWHLAGKPAPVLPSQSAFDHLHEPLVGYSNGAKYACGWICLDTGLGPALNHGGSNTNSFALIWVLPESDFAAVVCTNTGQRQAFPACDEMMTHLMTAHAAAERTKLAESPPSDPGNVTPERLVGRYQLLPNFIFDVRNDNGRLMVGITNQPTQEVFADSPTKWSYRGVDARLEFHLRSKGPAYALTLHQNGNPQRAKRVRE
jgi:CubicO group peptidase (beta-lactamase class C family)